MKDPFFLGFALSIFSLFLLLINAILFLSTLKQDKNQVYKYVTIYLLVLLVVEFFCNAIGFLYPSQNFYLSHFYFNAQFILLSLVFYHLSSNQKLKKIIVFNYIVITMLVIGMYLNNNELFWQFNLFEIVSTSALLVIYVLLHLFYSLNNTKKYFYFSLGLLLYLICSSLIFISGNYELVFMEDPYIDIWIFNTFFYIVYQCLIFKEWLYIHKTAFKDE
jgi:hypothetical protein